jgi:CheY-like chemotaxis protein/HPt (histidine-containing phosphotransfer) domain-containing protein
MPVQVLVVDDDALSRDVLALLLRHAGYTVQTADSGDAALLHLQTAEPPPRVILTDLQMPGTSGSDLARRLRVVCDSQTMLLAMSGSAPDDETAREFDGFLLKPFAIEALAAAIAGGAAGVAKTSPAPSTKVLDEVVFRKLAASMRLSRLEQLYALCLTDARARVVAMRRAATQGDDQAYKREAHAIKGGCGMVGATELQALATSMEQRGLRNDHVASLDQFVAACGRLERMLDAHDISHDQASRVSGEDA